jgi:hypothetical protein
LLRRAGGRRASASLQFVFNTIFDGTEIPV